MLRNIATLMVSRFEYDVDAAAFFSAAGITNQTQKNAINSLVVAAKTNGWWTKCNAIYPIVGGSATTHKYNLKDPRDLDAAFRLNFQGSWTHSSTGALPDGSTAYADSFLVPSTDLLLNDNHVSFYSRTNSDSGGDVASELTNDNRIILTAKNAGNYIVDMYSFTTSRISVANTDSTGWYLGSRRSSSDLEAYKNGSSVGTNSGLPSTTSTFSLYLSALNSAGTAVFFSNRQCAFATIGAGISSTLAATMYADIQQYQINLSRSV